MQALELSKVVLGPMQIYSMQEMHRVACIWHSLGREEAEFPPLREIVVLRNHIRGASHPHTIQSEETLAAWLEEQPLIVAHQSNDDKLASAGVATDILTLQPFGPSHHLEELEAQTTQASNPLKEDPRQNSAATITTEALKLPYQHPKLANGPRILSDDPAETLVFERIGISPRGQIP